MLINLLAHWLILFSLSTKAIAILLQNARGVFDYSLSVRVYNDF